MPASVAPEEFDLLHNLGDVIRHHGRVRGHVIAQDFEGRRTSYAELDRKTSKVANALIAAGVKPGECVAYLGKNSDLYFELVIGASKAGAIIAPIGWRLAPGEVAHIINDSQSKILFAESWALDCAGKALEEVKHPISIVAMDVGEHSHPVFEQWRFKQSEQDPRTPIDGQATALLLYTSGTTGRPKGVMLTSANLLRSRADLARAQMGWNEWEAGEVNLVAMPCAHIGGTGWGLVGFINGVTNVVLREFAPDLVLDTVVKHGIAKMFMVPAALQFVVRMPQARTADFSKLKTILYGASPIPLALLRECMEVFGCQFCQQYGLTETTGTISYLPPEDHDPNGNDRMRSAGLPMPGVEMRILDKDGNVLGPGEIGEVSTRSAANMRGYWRNEKATNESVDSDGWFRTGDAGYIDKDGYLFIQDRIKDMIVSGAENVYPAEVENAIHGHPDVAEVAVIGVPDEKWGEAVKAIVVPKPGAARDPESIIAYARTKIASYKAPKSVDFREAPLPRNPSGKILRRELREPYWAGRDRRVN